MGLIGGILQPLYIGRPNVLMSPMSFLQKPYRWLSAISRFHSTTSGGPNFAYDLCVRKVTAEQRKTLDLSSWRVAFNGAEPVHPETLDAFAEAFAPCGFRREAFFPCFGLAEATLIVSGGFVREPPVIRAFDSAGLARGEVIDADPDDEGVRSLVGCGRNLPDQKIVISDPETMTLCPAQRVGEIWVSGPSVAQGYWQQQEATEANVLREAEGYGRRAVPADGRPRVHAGRRTVRHRSAEGPDYHPWGELLSAGHRVHRASQPSAAAPGCGSRIYRGARWPRAACRGSRGGAAQAIGLRAIFEAIRRAVASEHELAPDAIVLLRAGACQRPPAARSSGTHVVPATWPELWRSLGNGTRARLRMNLS